MSAPIAGYGPDNRAPAKLAAAARRNREDEKMYAFEHPQQGADCVKTEMVLSPQQQLRTGLGPDGMSPTCVNGIIAGIHKVVEEADQELLAALGELERVANALFGPRPAPTGEAPELQIAPDDGVIGSLYRHCEYMHGRAVLLRRLANVFKQLV